MNSKLKYSLPITVIIILSTLSPVQAEDYAKEIFKANQRIADVRRELTGVKIDYEKILPAMAPPISSCDGREKYIAEKIRTGLSPRALLQSVAAKRVDVVLLGDTHSARDYLSWMLQAVTAYKQIRPEFDCVFSEEQPNPFDDDLYGEASTIYRTSKSVNETLKKYAKTRKLPLKIQDGQFAILGAAAAFDDGMYSGKSGWTNGEGKYWKTPIGTSSLHFPLLQIYFNSGVKHFGVDDRFDLKNVSRDLYMPEYIHRLFKEGRCHAAIMLTGKGHLRPLKAVLATKGISAYTVGFQNLNLYHRRSPFVSGLVTTPSFFDDEKCEFKDGRIRVPTAFETGDDLNSPKISADDTLFDFRWNSFDAQIVAPVSATPEIAREQMKDYQPIERIF